ncbi:MAG: ATP-binding cassette domain-containing protein [Tolypothrix brevis GSE-NOS-MK-07-07A]|nr:ATP-binding cassette domain-containing protein [Tolypothrix brevis GSE-NOS-MK-07-07A]
MPVLTQKETTEKSVHFQERETAVRSKSSVPIVQLRSVTKTYKNGSQALFDLNLEVKQGDFLFITGASGSGKSTLLKLLYGEELPTQGEVIVDEYNVAKMKGDRLSFLRRRIGIVFQDYKLIPQRTVAENVTFVLQAQGYTRKEILRRLEPTLKLVGLLSKADCFPDQLSGGEQQRVSIARAIYEGYKRLPDNYENDTSLYVRLKRGYKLVDEFLAILQILLFDFGLGLS